MCCDRCLVGKIFFGGVPELDGSIRISEEAPPESPSVDGDDARLTLGELRLHVLRSLPRRHEQYLIQEIRKWCSAYLHDNPVAARKISRASWSARFGYGSLEQSCRPTRRKCSIFQLEKVGVPIRPTTAVLNG